MVIWIFTRIETISRASNTTDVTINALIYFCDATEPSKTHMNLKNGVLVERERGRGEDRERVFS